MCSVAVLVLRNEQYRCAVTLLWFCDEWDASSMSWFTDEKEIEMVHDVFPFDDNVIHIHFYKRNILRKVFGHPLKRDWSIHESKEQHRNLNRFVLTASYLLFVNMAKTCPVCWKHYFLWDHQLLPLLLVTNINRLSYVCSRRNGLDRILSYHLFSLQYLQGIITER